MRHEYTHAHARIFIYICIYIYIPEQRFNHLLVEAVRVAPHGADEARGAHLKKVTGGGGGSGSYVLNR